MLEHNTPETWYNALHYYTNSDIAWLKDLNPKISLAIEYDLIITRLRFKAVLVMAAKQIILGNFWCSIKLDSRYDFQML